MAILYLNLIGHHEANQMGTMANNGFYYFNDYYLLLLLLLAFFANIFWCYLNLSINLQKRRHDCQ